VCTHFV
ncbi:bacterial extracellular solute-binding s, 3 family protein, partial [Vibrio parahaemolyticus V-223/04]